MLDTLPTEQVRRYRDLLEAIAAIRLDGEEDLETQTTVEMDIDSAYGLLSDIVERAREALEATKEEA